MGWFRAPAVVLLLAIVVYPLFRSVQLSFESYSPLLPGRTGQWVGLQNYRQLTHDPALRGAILRVAVFTFCAVVLEFAFGLIFALLLSSIAYGRRLVTSLMIVPMVLTPVVIGLCFALLLNPQFGALNYLLKHLGLGFATNALNSPHKALPALIAVDVWQWTPFMALLLFAGMQALPQDPLEAAQVDGASKLSSFWFVMVPMLRPVVVVAILFRAAEAVREFDKVFVLTGGGPGNATEVTDLFTYRQSFTVFDLSYGAAIGMVVFLATLLAGAVFFALVRRGGRIA